MAKHELEAEQLIILPMRLETIVITGGPVNQRTGMIQANGHNQVGSDCMRSGSDPTNVEINIAKVNQDGTSETTVNDVIDDHARFPRGF